MAPRKGKVAKEVEVVSLGPQVILHTNFSLLLEFIATIS